MATGAYAGSWGNLDHDSFDGGFSLTSAQEMKKERLRGRKALHLRGLAAAQCVLASFLARFGKRAVSHTDSGDDGGVTHGAAVGDLTDRTATDARWVLECPQPAGEKTLRVRCLTRREGWLRPSPNMHLPSAGYGHPPGAALLLRRGVARALQEGQLGERHLGDGAVHLQRLWLQGHLRFKFTSSRYSNLFPLFICSATSIFVKA